MTFVLHAGSEAKNYRLELWSGKREETATVGNEAGETVIFDYSYTTVSDDSMKSFYEQQIIGEYLDALSKIDGALDGIDTTGKNIAYFEELAKKHDVSIGTDYASHYYTYSLYDSTSFQPFNKTVADENATGYDYNVSEQTETLAYLKIRKGSEYTVFTDYAAVDKSITLNDSSDSDTDDDKDEDKENDGSVWLLISSIVLVVVLLFTMIAIFLRDALKKARRNKVTSKNNYDQRRTNRYKRKLHLTQEEIIEVEPETAEPVEETPADEVTETVEENAEAPEADVEETNAEEASDEDGKQE